MSVSRDEPIRIVVVDDHQIVRDGLLAMLAPHADVEVVGAAANAAEAMALVETTSPDAALVDVNLGGESGIQLSRDLIAKHPWTRVICLTVHDEQQYLFEALRSGVSGFLLKRVVPEGLIAALRGVLAGETVVDPLLSGRVVKIAAESEARGTFWPGLQYGLTKREAELLELLAEGLPNKEVASHLFIGEETVKSHLKSIYRKLSVSDRTEAVAVALREGLVPRHRVQGGTQGGATTPLSGSAQTARTTIPSLHHPTSRGQSKQTKDPFVATKDRERSRSAVAGRDQVFQLATDTLRVLAIDAIESANSGHPGAPMGMAEMATVLWTEFLVVDPAQPDWPDRDRFILSNGHGSMLLYSLLHLSGFDLSLADLRSFRRYGSATPGHPEFGRTPGVEVTTGPLGQGFATGVGMAIAEAHLRAKFGPDLVNHRVFGFVSDGDLMEGVAQEAASLAGHLGLGKLVYLYDDNEITIDGSTDLAFSEEVEHGFRAKGWHTDRVDGHDPTAIRRAIRAAVDEEERPSLIACRTIIGRGAPNKQGTSAVHGAPLGPDESIAAKEALSWPRGETFSVPDEVYGLYASAMARGREAARAWEARRDAAFESSPQLRKRWDEQFNPRPVSLRGPDATKPGATRAHSGSLFRELEREVPTLLGGSADLASSTKTKFPDSAQFSRADRMGRNIAFGVREHAMGSIVNGLTLHSGTRGFGSTFLVFSDYMRPAIRLAALMGIPSIFVFTHDSIMVGQDGPTHQPIEHVASLRLIPNLWVIRPADGVETTHAWQTAINRSDGPTALILTRQAVPALPRTSDQLGPAGTAVLRDGSSATLVATGSEVALSLDAADLLSKMGIELRVVSVPCVEAFAGLSDEAQESILGAGLPRMTLEAGATAAWAGLVGSGGLTLGLDRFGASGSAKELADALGFTPDGVADKVQKWWRSRG